jgi:hypothetical protein
MGRPKRCASRVKPYIKYNQTSSEITTTTTEEPIDYSSYIVIPESGAICPGATTQTTTTTTTTPEPFLGCKVYRIFGSNYVVKYLECGNPIEKIIFRCSEDNNYNFICVSGKPPEILYSNENVDVVETPFVCFVIS